MNIYITIITIYIILTFTEWYIHKNVMHKSDCKIGEFINYLYYLVHNEKHSKSHINHHSIMDPDGKILEEDSGIYFNIYSSLFLIPISFIIYCIISRLINNKHTYNEYIIIFIVFSLLSISYYKIWNIIHPKYHRYNDTYNENNIIENNFIYKYLEKYHMIHHLNKGDNKCNFNIVVPGADFIMGTYKGCVSNKEYYENNKNLSDNDKKLYLKELNNEQLPYGISYCN